MPEMPAEDPLRRTEPRARRLLSISWSEIRCVAIPTDRGLEWFPASVTMSEDSWLLSVRELWTSVRSIETAEIGRKYPMKLTAEGLALLRQWRRPDLADRDRRVS